MNLSASPIVPPLGVLSLIFVIAGCRPAECEETAGRGHRVVRAIKHGELDSIRDDLEFIKNKAGKSDHDEIRFFGSRAEYMLEAMDDLSKPARDEDQMRNRQDKWEAAQRDLETVMEAVDEVCG